jgi:hypothetical protein
MGEAEIIDFGSRGQASRARRRAGPKAESHEALGNEGSDFESEEVPQTSALGALFSELARLASRSFQSLRSVPAAQLSGFAADQLHTLVALAQTLGVDWEGPLDETAAFIRKRLRGDYAIDEFGFDPEFTTKIFLPLLRRLADSWFRVEVRGAENLPADGSALLVSNHAGTLPIDGMILHSVVYDEIGRHVRMLGATRNACSRPINLLPSFPKASKALASRTPIATSCSGLAAEDLSQPLCGPRCPSSRRPSWGQRRSFH